MKLLDLRTGILGGILIAAAILPASAQYELKGRRDHAVGQTPVGVIAADFDADGNPDLISVDRGSGSLSLVKGFGDGTFRTLGSVTAGVTPTGAVYVDVNHDSHPDLVASNFLTSDVTVNLGDGFGGFQASIGSPVGATAFGLTVGDWNHDTHQDVATVNTTTDTISVLRGNGAGGFTNLVQYTVGIDPAYINSADFNADTFADLVVSNTGSDNVQVWRNNGAGGFTLNATLSTGVGSGPLGTATGDLNADGRPDLVVCLRDADQVRVYLADTSGGFQSPTTLNPGLGPRAVTIADLNKDAKPDLIVGMALISGVGQLAVLTGNGTGGFSAPVIASTGPRPDSLTVGDFNKDGNLDVVAASLVGNTLCVLETTAGGTFLVADRVQLAANSTPTNVVVADFNMDGKPDIAATSESTDEVAIVRGNGTGGFLAPVTQPTGNTSGPWALVALDVNGDLAPDLAVLNEGTNDMSVLTNNGSGSFSSSNGQSIGVCESPVAISAGEIDGNLHSDIAYVCDVSYHLCTRRGTGLGGANAFGPALCAFYDGLPDPEGVVLGQFNLDGLMDPAFTTGHSDPPPEVHAVAVGISDGVGGLADAPGVYPTGTLPRGIARGDLNNDTYDDIVVANAGLSSISALIGDGGGAFTPPIVSEAGRNPNQVALADFNLDGFLDAAAVNTNANNVSFLLGDGYGNFTKVGDFGARDLPLSIAAGDFNGDNKPDIVVADYWSESLTILLNQSPLPSEYNPMQTATILGLERTVYRWGIVPGAVYDVIRGSVSDMTSAPGTNNLGPVTCLADDLPVPDMGNIPDLVNPPVGQAFFYLVRTTIGYEPPGPYTISTPDGKPGLPSSGGCQ